MNEALPASAVGKSLEVWFQDEARVGQKGWIPYQWAPIGSRPPAVRDNRHDSVYMFGAICPAREVGAAIIMPAANTEAMNEHLAEISTQVQPGAHAVLICDGAGWHQRGKKLRIPTNISLIPLPPYSPELIPEAGSSDSVGIPESAELRLPVNRSSSKGSRAWGRRSRSRDWTGLRRNCANLR